MKEEVLHSAKSGDLDGKRIGLCVTGSIAAVCTVKLCRELRRHGAEVFAIMSDASRDIINPMALQFATGNDVITKVGGKVEHVLLAGDTPTKLDLLIVCPCTKNTLSKIAYGICDTAPTLFVSTAVSHIPILVIPSMHKTMYDSCLSSGIVERVQDMGVKVYSEPASEGKVKMPSAGKVIFEARKLLGDKKFNGIRALVSAGPTIEYIDDVRYITNKSTGKMGIAIAEELEVRGASVRLALGRTTETSYVDGIVNRETYTDMSDEILNDDDYDIYVLSMAASDFSVEKKNGKISSNDRLCLDLVPNLKIIDQLRERKKGIIIGFKAEHDVTEDELVNRARSSIGRSGADLIVANDVGKPMRGFGTDTNEVYVVDAKGFVRHIPLSSKADVAKKVVDRIGELL